MQALNKVHLLSNQEDRLLSSLNINDLCESAVGFLIQKLKINKCK